MADQPEIIVTVQRSGKHTDGRYRVLEIDHDYSDPDNPALKLWLDPDSEQPSGGFRLPDESGEGRAVASVPGPPEPGTPEPGTPEPGTPEPDDAPDLIEVTAAAISNNDVAPEIERQVRERVAAELLAVDPAEWALAGARAGQDAARIARGETR